MMQFKTLMLAYALGAGKALCEISQSAEENSIKLEPEQVRKNAATILVILTETEDFLKEFDKNNCSDSAISIADEG